MISSFKSQQSQQRRHSGPGLPLFFTGLPQGAHATCSITALCAGPRAGEARQLKGTGPRDTPVRGHKNQRQERASFQDACQQPHLPCPGPLRSPPECGPLWPRTSVSLSCFSLPLAPPPPVHPSLDKTSLCDLSCGKTLVAMSQQPALPTAAERQTEANRPQCLEARPLQQAPEGQPCSDAAAPSEVTLLWDWPPRRPAAPTPRPRYLPASPEMVSHDECGHLDSGTLGPPASAPRSAITWVAGHVPLQPQDLQGNSLPQAQSQALQEAQGGLLAPGLPHCALLEAWEVPSPPRHHPLSMSLALLPPPPHP